MSRKVTVNEYAVQEQLSPSTARNRLRSMVKEGRATTWIERVPVGEGRVMGENWSSNLVKTVRYFEIND